MIPKIAFKVPIPNAFQKVHVGFARFLHNWTTITEPRSIYRRLHEFEYNLRRFAPRHTDSGVAPSTGAP